LPTDAGMAALYRAFYGAHVSVMVVHGAPRVLERTHGAIHSPAAGADILARSTLGRLRQLLGQTLHIEPDRIDPDESLQTYGIDSLRVMQINDLLARHFEGLSKTLLYEHRTLRSLSTHLVSHHGAHCACWIDGGEPPSSPASPTIVSSPTAVSIQPVP